MLAATLAGRRPALPLLTERQHDCALLVFMRVLAWSRFRTTHRRTKLTYATSLGVLLLRFCCLQCWVSKSNRHRAAQPSALRFPARLMPLSSPKIWDESWLFHATVHTVLAVEEYRTAGICRRHGARVLSTFCCLRCYPLTCAQYPARPFVARDQMARRKLQCGTVLRSLLALLLLPHQSVLSRMGKLQDCSHDT